MIMKQQQQQRMLCTILLLLLSWQIPRGAAFVISPLPQQGPRILSTISQQQRRCLTRISMASIAEQVTEQMKVAMKAKDTTTLATVRLIRSAFANACIELHVKELNDEQAVTVLRKLAKMRQESIQMFQDGGALDRADVERAELAVIERWLPQLASEEQTTQWVLEAIEKVGSVDNVGKIMGALMQQHKQELDGTLAQRIVKEQVAKAKQAK